MLKRIYDNKLAIFLFVLIVFFVCVGLSYAYLSYAYWRLTLTQSNSNLVTSDCFSLEFTDENDITLQNAYPMDDEEEFMNFLLETTPYHFKITNKCNKEITYTANLESLMLEDGVKRLSDKYIGVFLWDGEYSFSQILEDNLMQFIYIPGMDTGGRFTLDYLQPNQEKVLEQADAAYILDENNLGPNESKEYNLFLFIDPDTPPLEETMESTWEGKVTITSNYGEVFQEPSMLQSRCSGNGSLVTYKISCTGDTSLNTSFYQTKYLDKITRIVIQDSIKPIENAIETYDESFLKDESIISYVVENESIEGSDVTYTIYIQSDGKISLPPDSSGYFSQMPLLESIDGLNNLDTSLVNNMYGMFSGIAVQTLDLSSFTTYNVESFYYMFGDCENLTNIIYGNKFVNNSGTYEAMFYNCPANKPDWW